MTKGGESERARAWQSLILKDFNRKVTFAGRDDAHPWCGAIAQASDTVKVRNP
jgi:hypothetical protein